MTSLTELIERKGRELWILKTPGAELIENDEPMNMDWSCCKKTKYAEASESERLRQALRVAVFRLEECEVDGNGFTNMKVKNDLTKIAQILEGQTKESKLD